MLCRAKINLTLHVGAAISSGRWQGYHPVESLVVFADFGDWIDFAPSDATRLDIRGEFAAGLSVDDDNLVLKAARAIEAPPTAMTLTKNLPVSAGLGGGSANAASVLRQFRFDPDFEIVSLGADVPVCYLSKTAMMESIGERVTPIEGLGTIAAVLVNPGIAVSTGAIFKAFDREIRPIEPLQTSQSGSLLDRARLGRNDLQDIAIQYAPIIADVIKAIAEQPGCDLARMSGSGASCFGLFQDDEVAAMAANHLKNLGWWAVACRLGDENDAA